jgi:hypothetical protein
MSNKYIQENANEYCRPSLDDDDSNFFPYQGMLPLYCFKNNVLVNQKTDGFPNLSFNRGGLTGGNTSPTIEEENILINDNFYYLYLCTFFLCMILLINIFFK